MKRPTKSNGENSTPALTLIKGGRKGPKTPRGPATLKLVVSERKVS
jgi:hypothetical protein